MEDDIKPYAEEIAELEELTEQLTHYRDGCSDSEWEIIDQAIQCMEKKITQMKLTLADYE